MVMESEIPQNVGREFVRQYYTLLHEAPQHLFRFYSQDSCFVHGGVEKPGEEQPPTTGQSNIFKKIMAMNFNDCHAKIRQVDSQSTVKDAIVVQVTGELSNNGEHMRRFMQTFVLVPVAPKKYYVRNDIFRYQDEVFHDSDDVDDDNQEELVDSGSDMEPCPPETPYYEHAKSPQAAPALSNGNVHVDDRVPSPVPITEPEVAIVPVAAPVEVIEEPEIPEAVVPEPTPQLDTKPEQTTEETPNEVQPDAPVSNEPVSWAAMIAKKSSVPSGTVPPTAPPVVHKSAKSSNETTTPKNEATHGNKDTSQPQPQRAPRNNRPLRDSRSQEGPRHDANYEVDDRSQRSRFPDSQQVFVGNIPHNISETQLKNYFEDASNNGKVVELRINKKVGNPNIANYGFVIFDDEKTVQYILQHKASFQPLDGSRLNIEVKKQRTEIFNSRPSAGGRGNMGGGMRPGMSRGRGNYNSRGGGDNRPSRQSYGGGGSQQSGGGPRN